MLGIMGNSDFARWIAPSPDLTAGGSQRDDDMKKSPAKRLVERRDALIRGYAQTIKLRTYHPPNTPERLPLVLYFHGGIFVDGSLDDAHKTASALAQMTPAWVVSVGYSLAPQFPFPAAVEDGYCALKWSVASAAQYHADPGRIAVAGHDSGGNIAAGLAAMARDRREFSIGAQALLAPLLDPSMTRIARNDITSASEIHRCACAYGYRSYLQKSSDKIHPYAAPIESVRPEGLPSTLIAGAATDIVRMEAESYAGKLIEAGVPTQITRHQDMSHHDVATDPRVLADVAEFLRRL